MQALVTGATGFVGSALVRSLLGRSVRVKALVRSSSNLRNLVGLDFEICLGDLLDEEALVRAMSGCEVVYHTAAVYSTREQDAPLLYNVNVGGTKAVMRAAVRACVDRVVHTSTIGTIGQPEGDNLATEEQPFSQWETASHYAKSKVLGELAALRFCAKGLDVVVVNPCAPVGARDVVPSSTGLRIVDYLRGKQPAFLSGGINFVAVEDVAEGHVLAAERGRSGERYILGYAQGNLNLGEFQALMERVSGVKLVRSAAGRTRLLRRLRALGKGMVAVAAGKRGTTATDRRPPRLTCNPAKAIRELGLPQTPLQEAFAQSVAWFRENGYV